MPIQQEEIYALSPTKAPVESSSLFQNSFAKTLIELKQELGLLNVCRIRFTFRVNRVTACARQNHYEVGAFGSNLEEALTNLIERCKERFPLKA